MAEIVTDLSHTQIHWSVFTFALIIIINGGIEDGRNHGFGTRNVPLNLPLFCCDFRECPSNRVDVDFFVAVDVAASIWACASFHHVKAAPFAVRVEAGIKAVPSSRWNFVADRAHIDGLSLRGRSSTNCSFLSFFVFVFAVGEVIVGPFEGVFVCVKICSQSLLGVLDVLILDPLRCVAVPVQVASHVGVNDFLAADLVALVPLVEFSQSAENYKL